MHKSHTNLNLDTHTCPTKEQRLGSVNAYHGKVSKLFKECKKNNGTLPVLHRKFQQTEVCLLLQAAMRILSVRGAAVVVHGAVGCAQPLHSYREIFRIVPEELGRPPFELNWLSTNLDEHDVVYGGEEKLKEAIYTADKRYSPKAIFIITTCATGIIGDDVEGIVESVKNQVNAILVPIHCEGFRSQISQTAFDSIAHGVVKYLVKPPEKKQKDLVVIPAPYSVTWRDRMELDRLLHKIGLKTVYIPDFATVEELERLSEAAVIAPTCQSYGDYWQRSLHEKFDVPYFHHPIPLGIKNTELWLRDIAKYTGKENEVEQLIKDELSELLPRIEELKAEFIAKDASILIAAGQPRATFTPRLAHELGIKVKGVQTLELDSIMVDDLQEVYDEIGDFEIHASNWQPFELEHMDKRLNPGLHTACPMAGLFRRKGSILRNHSFRSDYTDPANQLGFRGILTYAYLMLRGLNNTLLNTTLEASVKKPYKKWWFEQKDMFYYTKEGNGSDITKKSSDKPGVSV